MTVIVNEYDARWPEVFARLHDRVLSAVADVALSVEHVGSTSVPGLPAKAVIDMDVVVAPNDVAAGIAALESIGYVHRGNLGIPQREAFHAPTQLPRHHLYLCPSDSPALANHLAVRDALRTDPLKAAEYGRLKKSLAHEFHDEIDAYVEGKSAFLLALLRDAGFSESALDDIERMNVNDGPREAPSRDESS